MALMVRCNRKIKGVVINKIEYKISQFADDTTCFVQTPASALAAMETLTLFESFSGLHINRDKSTVLPIGFQRGAPATVAGLRCGERTKILGVWFSSSRTPAEHYEWNFQPQINKMKCTCQAWCNRTLSYKGKITVINVLTVSLLQYIITATPKRVFPEVKKLACDSLWGGKRSKIAYNTIIQETQYSGLRLMDLEARVGVCMLSWARRVILSPESLGANLIKVFCWEANPVLVGAAKRDFSTCLSQTSTFYAKVLQVWHSLHNTAPIREEEIRKEIVNPRIPALSEHRSRSRWIRWIDAETLTVENLCHPKEDRLMGQEAIHLTYSIEPTFLGALTMRNSIPIAWKRALSKDFKGNDTISYTMDINGEKFDILNSSPKSWYKATI